MKSKSTHGEVICAWLLVVGIMTSEAVFLFTGARGWAFGGTVGLVMLVAVVAGVAER